MTTIHIPPAALEAGARAAYETYWRLQAEAVGMNPADLEPWDYHDAPTQEEWRTLARAAFEAMVGAWPDWSICGDRSKWIELPLPTENPDAEA